MNSAVETLQPAQALSSFDWNNAAEQTIAAVLGEVPVVGSLLSPLVYIFWPPTQTDVWAQVEQQVEQLINQDLSQLVQQQVAASLQGLNNNLSSYLQAVKNGDPSNIADWWVATNADFLQQLPTFQLPDYQLLLLPLFAQFANMHLGLLRDGVLGGAQWGWSAAVLTQTEADLKAAISTYCAYVQTVYGQGLQTVKANTPTNNHLAQPFRSVNTYVRQMTLTVLDFQNLWQYFDASVYPTPTSVRLTREIYSDPMGTCDTNGNLVLPSPPTQPVSQISVWAWDRIDAVQLTYPAGGGPGGVTQTARMGDQSGGRNGPPHGGLYTVANNPVVSATGGSGDIVNFMSFTFADGSSSGTLGGNYPGGTASSWSFPNEVLSSIYINGISNFYGSAECAVFGFQFSYTPSVSEAVRKVLYVSALAEPVSAAQATPAEWKAQRRAYWQGLQAKVKE